MVQLIEIEEQRARLITGRQHDTDALKGLINQLDELSGELQAKLHERQELKDEFKRVVGHGQWFVE